jgi:hypothetical protein
MCMNILLCVGAFVLVCVRLCVSVYASVVCLCEYNRVCVCV